MRTNGYTSAIDSETILLLRQGQDILIHGIYADDFLYCSNRTAVYTKFRDQIKSRFDIKMGPEDLYFGNKICVDKEKINASIDQTSYVDELLASFGLMDCRPVGTPIVVRLSNLDRGNSISKEEPIVY